MAGFNYYSAGFKSELIGFQTIPALGAHFGVGIPVMTLRGNGPWIGMETLFIKQDAFIWVKFFKYHYAFYDGDCAVEFTLVILLNRKLYS